MGLPKTNPILTVDEYLLLERAAKERHEYLDGKVFAMAGESGKHGDITVNLVISVGSQLKGTPCRARTKDTKVRSGPLQKSRQNTSGLFSYPDIVVIFGEPEYHDSFADVIINPTAIIEVLSRNTEAFDRGEKFTRYQTWNPTLQDYLLVSQDEPLIEHHSRQQDGTWSCNRITGLDSSVVIASIQCTLSLVEIYDRIVFSAE